MDMKGGAKEVKIIKLKEASTVLISDHVAIERPLEVRIRHRSKVIQIAITMRTPGSDIDLALGFLFTEGIIKDILDIIDHKMIDENVIEIRLRDQLNLPYELLQRNTFMSSSCGICGKASLDIIKTNSQYLPWTSKFKISILNILLLRSRLDEMDNLFSLTGGNHAVALFDLDANLIDISEDVGRHNAMDKLIGKQLQKNLMPLNNSISLLSGRASFELVQKAMMAGIGCIVAIGAPSSLAIELAEESGITLIGFLKNDSCNIYCGKERINIKIS